MIECDRITDCPEEPDVASFGFVLVCAVAEFAEVPVVAVEPSKLSPLAVFASVESPILLEVKPGTAKDDTVGRLASALTIVCVLERSVERVILVVVGLVSVFSSVEVVAGVT